MIAPEEQADARGVALVVFAYRCAMAETCGARASYRDGAWDVFEAAAPAGEAEPLFGCVYGFVRALLAAAERPLEFRPSYCAHLCRDERLAVAMIDAAQRGDVAGLLDAASALIGVEALGDALNATQALAAALARRGVFVCPRAGSCAHHLCPQRTLH